MSRLNIAGRDKGFTMIELMIAVSILGLIITGMTIALQQQQKQFRVTKEAVEVDQTARSTLDFLASEIRNAGARQGKSFALRFFNGGSEGDEPCTEDTDNAGSVNSPPDCLTVYTWDITRGQEGTDMPSVPGLIDVAQSEPLVLRLPSQWFPGGGNIMIGETEEDAEVLLGLRSRTALCSPDNTINCNVQPERCTECSVILRATVNGAAKTATVDSLDDIEVHNLPVENFSGMSGFINGTTVNGVNYGLLQTFSSLPSEMTIVGEKTLSVDPAAKSLMLSQNGGEAQAIAGGDNAPGIVDLQLVFNLQDANGGLTRIGVPLSQINGLFPDFQNPVLNGREQDIRSVEIYLVVKSKMKPRTMQGGQVTQTIPAIGDVSERTVETPSSVTSEPEEGYTYRVLSTTIYMRNHSREEFG